jgi:hypothetical protein
MPWNKGSSASLTLLLKPKRIWSIPPKMNPPDTTLPECRRGSNTLHLLTGRMRQSVFGWLAGYEDLNDADRLANDPAMQAVVDRAGLDRQAASASQMGRLETEWLTGDANLAAVTDLSGAWIDPVHARKLQTTIVSVSETHGAQERRQDRAARSVDRSSRWPRSRCRARCSRPSWPLSRHSINPHRRSYVEWCCRQENCVQISSDASGFLAGRGSPAHRGSRMWQGRASDVAGRLEGRLPCLSNGQMGRASGEMSETGWLKVTHEQTENPEGPETVELLVAFPGLDSSASLVARDQIANLDSVVEVLPVLGNQKIDRRSGETIDLASFAAKVAPGVITKFLADLLQIFTRSGAPDTEIEIGVKGKNVKIKFNSRRTSISEISEASAKIIAAIQA